jgi:phosphate-selective porin OprO/OprP
LGDSKENKLFGRGVIKMRVLKRKKQSRTIYLNRMYFNQKNEKRYASRVIAAILANLFVFLYLPLRAAIAEEHDPDLLERVKQLDEIIHQQEEQLKANEKKLQELKKEIEAQQNKIGKEDKQTTKEVIKEILHSLRMDYREPTPEEKRLETIYDDGFYLRGKDDVLKIGGWYQFDGRFYLDDDHPKANTFTNRRARLDARGVLEYHWGYRLYLTLVGSPVIQEAWLAYQRFPFARLKLGQFKEPFSLESQYSARWIDFVERSMGVTALQPAEDLGVMVFGNIWDSRVIYGIGIFNGQGRDEDAVVDDKDLTGRVVVQPFRQQKDTLFEKLHIGGSLGFGNNEIDLGDKDFKTAGKTTFYDFVSNAESDGKLIRYDAELEWLRGPFNLTTEFIATYFDTVKTGNAENELTVNSWYLTLSYVLTGEDAVRNAPIRPYDSFDLKEIGWGAWQLLVRYERFWIEDRDLIDKGIASGADGADAYSLGLNWWPNIHLKFMLNYVYTSFDDEITVSNKKLDDENLISFRAQFNF